MKFTIIYTNNENLENQIFSQLINWSKQTNFEEREVNNQHFKIIKNWPKSEILLGIPLNLQAREIEIIGDELKILKQLIIDVEILEKTYSEEKPQTSTEILPNIEEMKNV